VIPNSPEQEAFDLMKRQVGNVSGRDNGLAVAEASSGCHAISGGEYLSFGNRMEYVMLSEYWN
jgi:hypothetical protein